LIVGCSLIIPTFTTNTLISLTWHIVCIWFNSWNICMLTLFVLWIDDDFELEDILALIYELLFGCWIWLAIELSTSDYYWNWEYLFDGGNYIQIWILRYLGMEFYIDHHTTFRCIYILFGKDWNYVGCLAFDLVYFYHFDLILNMLLLRLWTDYWFGFILDLLLSFLTYISWNTLEPQSCQPYLY